MFEGLYEGVSLSVASNILGQKSVSITKKKAKNR